MTIELPTELIWVDELCGGAWPTVDEDRLFDIARAWRRAALGVREIDESADWVARDLVMNNEAGSLVAFDEKWDRSRANHHAMATAQDVIAEIAHCTGLAVESAKITIVGILALTATRLVHAKVNAFYVPGSAVDDAFHSVAAGRKAIERTRIRLHQFVEEQISGNAYQAAMAILERINSVDAGDAR